MIAYFEVQRNAGEPTRILKVDGVRDLAHAADLAKRIRQVHAEVAKLLFLEEYALCYTASEVESNDMLAADIHWRCGHDRRDTSYFRR
jgi:hypothetical protein